MPNRYIKHENPKNPRNQEVNVMVQIKLDQILHKNLDKKMSTHVDLNCYNEVVNTELEKDYQDIYDIENFNP